MGLVRRLATVRHRLSEDDDDEDEDEAHIGRVAAKGQGPAPGASGPTGAPGGAHNTQGQGGDGGGGAGGGVGGGGGPDQSRRSGVEKAASARAAFTRSNQGTQDIEAGGMSAGGKGMALQREQDGGMWASLVNFFTCGARKRARVASNASGKRTLKPSLKSQVGSKDVVWPQLNKGPHSIEDRVTSSHYSHA